MKWCRALAGLSFVWMLCSTAESFAQPATGAAAEASQKPASGSSLAVAPPAVSAGSASTEPPDSVNPGAASSGSAAVPGASAGPRSAPTLEVGAAPAAAAAEQAASDDKAASKGKKSRTGEGESEPRALDGDVFGDRGAGLRVGFLSFRFLTQVRFRRTWAASSQNASASARVIEDTLAREGDGLGLHRFALRLAADPSPYLQLKSIIDFAEFVHDNADASIKQAYVDLRPIPKRLVFSVGLFKLPFSILELDPTADFPFADLGMVDDLIKDLGFAGRDIGAEVTISPLPKAKWLRIALGAFRGHAKDESKAFVGTLGARIEIRPFKGLRIGADWVGHPQGITYKNPLETSSRDIVPNPADPMYPRSRSWARGQAFSADLLYSRHHIRFSIEGMIGDRVDVDMRYSARSFYAVWGLLGYRFRTRDLHWLPAVRATLWDADRENPVGLRRELSAGLNVDITDNVRLLFEVTRIDVQSDTPLVKQPKPIPQIPYMQLDDTLLTTQLQVVI